MTGINFITNQEGVHTGLIIDLEQMRHEHNSSDIEAIIEDLEDIIAIELHQSSPEEYSDWEDVKKRLKEKGVIDEDL